MFSRFIHLPGREYGDLIAGTILISLMLFAGLAAPVLAPHDPQSQNLVGRLASPSLDYPFGTDNLGRCVASRILHGVRPTLGLALAISVAVAMIGLIVGLSCSLSPVLDGLLMRIADMFFAFPQLILSLVIIGITGPSFWGMLIALVLPGWPKYARVVRTTAVSASTAGFVEATRALGAGRLYILRRCLLPHVLPQVATIFTVGVGGKIVSIASLGVLGLGVPPPSPEWGGMLVKGLPVLAIAPHIAVSAALAIILATLAFTLTGEGLARLFQPQIELGETQPL